MRKLTNDYKDKRIHITITKQLLDILDAEQLRTGAPRAELIRRAIIHKYCNDKSDK